MRYWRTGNEQRRNEVFPTVLWLVTNKRRADVLRAALADHEAGPLSEVVTTEDLPSYITNTRREGQP